MHARVFSEEKKVITIQLLLNTDFRHIFQIPRQFSPKRLITGHKSSNFFVAVVYMGNEQVSVIKELDEESEKSSHVTPKSNSSFSSEAAFAVRST